MSIPRTEVSPVIDQAPPLTPASDVQLAPLERAKSRVGHVVRGKWRLDALLGAGGTAAVYAATHRNRSRAAIKMLHPELSAQPSIRGCFLREGYAANGVPHDGVVRVIDDDIAEDGSVFLVMELLEGETLKERLDNSKGPLAMDESLKIADRVLDVLAAAHAQGIQHRDITPKNVFLTRDGKLKIIDFGSAFVAELSQQSGVTLTGLPMGTPAFMSPELARGRFPDVDPRSDVFSTGALLFMMLTAKPARRAETPNEELLLAMTEPVTPIAKERPELPQAIMALVDRAVAFDKAERWPGARAMQDALILAREGLSSVPEVVAEVVAEPMPESWNPGPTIVGGGLVPYGAPPPPSLGVRASLSDGWAAPNVAPDASSSGMNPLFMGADGKMKPGSHAPVAHSAPPYAGRRRSRVPAVLVGLLLVFGALIAGAFLFVDKDAFPVRLSAARTSKPAPLPSAPVSKPPSPATDLDTLPPPTATSDKSDKNDKPADKAADKTTPASSPKATTPARSPSLSPPPRRTSNNPPATTAGQNGDGLVRVNPFDRRD